MKDERTGQRHERDRQVTLSSFQEAERLRIRLSDELAAELAGEHRKRSKLGDVALDWLKRTTLSRRHDGSCRYAPTTVVRYTNAVQRIVEFLGDRYVDKLQRRDIEDWRDHLAQYMRSSTVNGLLRVLRLVLRDAGSNAADAVKGLREDDGRITDDEPNALTEKELARFVLVAREHHAKHFAMLVVLATTGARMSSVRALRWDDIDEREGVMTFRRRVSGHEVLPGVKRSRTSKDVVPLLPEVLSALQEHRAGFNVAQRSSGLVFPSRKGGHRARSVLDKVIRDVLRRAGITKRLTPHGLRRTASSLLRRAADSVVTKAIIGHTSDQMHEHYSVVGLEEKQAATKRAFGPHLKLVQTESGDQSGNAAAAKKVSASR